MKDLRVTMVYGGLTGPTDEDGNPTHSPDFVRRFTVSGPGFPEYFVFMEMAEDAWCAMLNDTQRSET